MASSCESPLALLSPSSTSSSFSCSSPTTDKPAYPFPPHMPGRAHSIPDLGVSFLDLDLDMDRPQSRWSDDSSIADSPKSSSPLTSTFPMTPTRFHDRARRPTVSHMLSPLSQQPNRSWQSPSPADAKPRLGRRLSSILAQADGSWVVEEADGKRIVIAAPDDGRRVHGHASRAKIDSVRDVKWQFTHWQGFQPRA